MRQNQKQQPIILLIDDCAEKNTFIKNWLELNNFSMRETHDIYDVLDEISDFTMPGCPDVFMLPIDSFAGDDFHKIEEIVHDYSDSANILIATVSGESETFSAKQLAGTEANLNALLPPLAQTAASV